MTSQHWLVAQRRAEHTHAALEESQAEAEQPSRAIVRPLTHPVNRSRRDHTGWMRESLADIYGYASLGEMYSRMISGPRWYDVEVEDMAERELSPWRTRQLVCFYAGTLVPREMQGTASRSESVLSRYGSEDNDEEDSFFSGRETRRNDTPSSGHESNSGNTPSSAGESDDGNAQFLPQALQLAHYSIENHTMMLYQDLMSIFRHHTDAREPHSQAASASALANTEMNLLMSHFEDSLAYFGHNSSSSNTPAYLYSGVSERIKQSIVYCAYIASDRAYFPTSSFSAMPWSYLGPKKYSASRLKRQRISSDVLMVFQNKRALLREFKSVLWGRRRYLRWLERYPEVVAKAMWMLDPTFTHIRVGLIDSLVERLEEAI